MNALTLAESSHDPMNCEYVGQVVRVKKQRDDKAAAPSIHK